MKPITIITESKREGDFKFAPEEEVLIRAFRALPKNKADLYRRCIHDCAAEILAKRPPLQLIEGGKKG